MYGSMLTEFYGETKDSVINHSGDLKAQIIFKLMHQAVELMAGNPALPLVGYRSRAPPNAGRPPGIIIAPR